MKVSIEKGYRDIYTIADVRRAKAIIAAEKDDEMSAKDWAEYAVKEALTGTDDCIDRIIEATAHTARNSRIWNCYSDESFDMDVLIEAIARTRFGFVEIEAYLTDIWHTGEAPYKHMMYIRHCIEKQ